MSQIAYWLSLAAGGLVALLFLTVVIYILIGKISIEGLLNDENGKPSLARFQFLVFTAVVAMGLLIIVLSSEPPAFPAIDRTILILLGLSASSYLTSKGLEIFRAVRREQSK
jgi:hypothetical protein